ncbi:unnamed protein product [Staurois parvus]|uniref:Secreted protein n=1 Tax=Staurois parvus TaxID=386267 RepID=A0ABN9GSL6_9NEOB|nr:unnamed protein product [Staurois parvus]
MGTGGGTAGNGWAGLVGALLGGTCGCHCWAPIIRALIISALMIGADPRSDNCRFSAVLSSRSDSLLVNGCTFLTLSQLEERGEP